MPRGNNIKIIIMEPVKIQINSLAALERLIGEDPEVEFEIRKSVLSHFFGKSNQFTEKISRQLESEMVNIVFDNKSTSSYRTEYVLKDEYAAVIQATVNEAIDKTIWPRINELLRDDLIAAQVSQIVNVWTSGQIQSAIDKGVRDVLSQQLDLIQKVNKS